MFLALIAQHKSLLMLHMMFTLQLLLFVVGVETSNHLQQDREALLEVREACVLVVHMVGIFHT
jgi:uncharacterized membrane protein YbjE (DUF340 family)